MSYRSAPVTTMDTKPNGKMSAPIMRISPGAFSVYQGDELTTRTAAQAKESRQPARKALKNILSRRMLAFMTPAREASSVASLGV